MTLDVYVFSPIDISLLGIVDTITGLIWQEYFSDAGSFELWCPLTPENSSLLQTDNIVWLKNKDSAGIIEIIEPSIDSEGIPTLHIKGRLAECYLDYRSVYPVFASSGRAGAVIRGLVTSNIVNPSNPLRKISTLSLSSGPEQNLLGPSISYQQTGGSLLTEVSTLCGANLLGFRLKFIPPRSGITPGFVFTLCEGTDRSMNQVQVDPVLFSSELDEILGSTYLYNKTDLKNIAYVGGEDSGASRVYVEVESGVSTSGVFRRELFVDARDLQSEVDGTTLTPTEYRDMLIQRGKTDLDEYKEIETFDSTLRTFGNVSYVYGVDFNLGDLVTIFDRRLGVQIDAYVTSSIDTYDEEGHTFELVFGYEQPTISKKLKRRI